MAGKPFRQPGGPAAHGTGVSIGVFDKKKKIKPLHMHVFSLWPYRTDSCDSELPLKMFHNVPLVNDVRDVNCF